MVFCEETQPPTATHFLLLASHLVMCSIHYIQAETSKQEMTDAINAAEDT